MSEGIDHWRGTVDTRLADHERRLGAINGNVKEGALAITGLAVEVGKLGTRVAVYAAVGGLFASVLSSIATGLVVYFATH